MIVCAFCGKPTEPTAKGPCPRCHQHAGLTVALEPHKPQHFENAERTTQRVLVTGLDCLPGQLDLF
jgi:hypothetical protein